VAAKAKAPRRAVGSHSFKRRQLEMADGGKLVLRPDGAITQTDAAGEVTRTWAAIDPEWAGMAIRFGVLPQTETTVPDGRRVADPRPRD
jgi:hypothetical protein